MGTNNFKYPGTLGKRLTRKELDAASDAALNNVPPNDLAANRIAAREYEQDRTAKLVVELMKHFGIPLDADPGDQYCSLALRLARRHVPAFQEPIRAGRKRKKPFGSLVDILNQIAKAQKKKTGRPQKWTTEMRLVIEKDIKDTCEKEGIKPGRGSTKRALELLFKRAPVGRRQYWIKRIQRLHSENIALGLA